METLRVDDDRLIKTKTRTSGDKIYSNFCGLNVPKEGVECKSFTIIYIDYLIIYIYVILLYLLMKANITDKYI